MGLLSWAKKKLDAVKNAPDYSRTGLLRNTLTAKVTPKQVAQAGGQIVNKVAPGAVALVKSAQTKNSTPYKTFVSEKRKELFPTTKEVTITDPKTGKKTLDYKKIQEASMTLALGITGGEDFIKGPGKGKGLLNSMKDKIKQNLEDNKNVRLGSIYRSQPAQRLRANPLIEEAKKYKSAEEFVNKSQQVFRGGSKLDITKINEEGLPVTFDNKIAEQFARIKNQFDAGPAGQILGKKPGQNIVEKYYVSPSAKVATRADIPDDVFKAYKEANPLTKPNIAEPIVNKWAKDNGFDAIDFRTLGKTSAKEAELKVLNPDILKTKSQLTDIWKNATSRKIPQENMAGDLGRAGKSPTEPGLSLKPQSRLQVLSEDSSLKAYTPQEKNAIVKTASQTGKAPKEVSSFVSKIKEFKTKTVEYVQNTDERVRKLVNTKGAKVSDSSDPYLKATLYPGRVATKIEQAKSFAGKALKEMHDAKINRKDVSDYLVSRHAPERNAALGEGAAGITTKEANARFAELGQNKKLVAIADKVQAIHNETLNILKDSGVISKELFDTLRNKYKNHVPLQRIIPGADDFAGALSGKGFDVRSSGIKAARGSSKEVDDILNNVITNYEQAVIRSEKNIVDAATLKFVRDNKSILGDLFQEIHPKAIGQSFDGKILMEQTQDPSILQMFENGKKVWIKIGDPNLAIALKGIGREKLGGLLNAVASFTRLYSGLQTRFNPEFALPNKLRDIQETAVYLASQKGTGFKGAGKAALRDPASIKSVTEGIMGLDTKGAKLYREMKEMGGTTGGMGLSTKKQVELDLDKLQKLASSKPRAIANTLVEYVDNWNTIFEDSTRLSVYKTALDQGLSKDRAAFLAKEASINFNRMGKGGPVINALWMFANASIQGSAKMLRSFKNPKVLGATALVVGGSVGAVNEWNDKADPNWRDKVSRYDRLNGLPVVLPSQDGHFRYITIPVSWGIKPMKVMADYAYDAYGGDFKIGKFTDDLATSIIEAYNPVGGSDLTSALVPTVLDTPVEIARNTAWSGNKIRPDYDKNAPRDIQYFSSLKETKTGEAAISLSEFLQGKTGIAISPADIKYAYDQYIGGTGRTATKLFNLGEGVSTNNPPPLDEFPFVSRFYREKGPDELGKNTSTQTQDVSKLLENQSRDRLKLKNKAEQLDQELSQLPPEVARAKFDEIKKQDPLLAEKIKDIATDRKLGLTYTEKLIKQLGVENGERAKYIDEQIMALPSDKRRAYYEELKRKKLISDSVAKQIQELVTARKSTTQN